LGRKFTDEELFNSDAQVGADEAVLQQLGDVLEIAFPKWENSVISHVCTWKTKLSVQKENSISLRQRVRTSSLRMTLYRASQHHPKYSRFQPIYKATPALEGYISAQVADEVELAHHRHRRWQRERSLCETNRSHSCDFDLSDL
jgi:hypothetical protein